MILLAVGSLVIWKPFSKSDVAQLQPVELLFVSMTSEGVRVATETGDLGEGEDLKGAMRDLEESAVGKVFLETAEYLLVTDGARGLLPELTSIMRPGCAVCVAPEEVNMEKAAEYLNIHRPEVTLNDYWADQTDLPRLKEEEGRFKIEWSGTKSGTLDGLGPGGFICAPLPSGGNNRVCGGCHSRSAVHMVECGVF